jgi:para-nitrobenzyl esterase
MVKGYELAGIHTFLGVAYGDDTGASRRFMPPRAPKPWRGTRLAYRYGNIAPQLEKTAPSADDQAFSEGALLNLAGEGTQSEDCLRLNIWTPGLDGAKRPVMVWLHGGNFSTGSGHALAAYEGSNLSRRGDVVVVSLNHRLNVLGHLNLAQVSDDYSASANVGMLDIVLALEWVRDTIADFGGDPDCVTIFGQSGGGAKVTTLMAMPAAAGLFHRAIVQSNSALRQMDEATSLALTAAVLAELGVPPGQVGKLHDLPYAELSRAEQVAVARLCPPANPARRNQRVRWEPVVDGTILPRHGAWPDAPILSAQVPLLVGTTLNEFTHAIGRPDLEAMSFAEVSEAFLASFGETGPAILELLRARHPEAKPFDILSRGYSATIRECAVQQAQQKAALGAAPAWLYWFCWQTPMFDGRPRAYHNSDLPFVFNNLERCALATGSSADAIRLGEEVSDAWIAFARHGNPNHSRLPDWKPVTVGASQTMVLDASSHFSTNPDEAERRATGRA